MAKENENDIFTPERARDFLSLSGMNPRASHDNRAMAIIAAGKEAMSLSALSRQLRETDDFVQARRDRARRKALNAETRREETWRKILEEAQVGKLNRFMVDGVVEAVAFVKTEQVAEGVECDVYRFERDVTKDLGIIRIQGGHATPFQRVLQGEKTIEGHMSGDGSLYVEKPDGGGTLYETERPFSATIETGDVMQWHAARGSTLIAYEICYPPYQDGRFENL
jgi:hypothetical protein